MLFRRIARPLLSAVFIGQGIDSLLNPKSAAEAAAPTVTVFGPCRIRWAATFPPTPRRSRRSMRPFKSEAACCLPPARRRASRRRLLPSRCYRPTSVRTCSGRERPAAQSREAQGLSDRSQPVGRADDRVRRYGRQAVTGMAGPPGGRTALRRVSPRCRDPMTGSMATSANSGKRSRTACRSAPNAAANWPAPPPKEAHRTPRPPSNAAANWPAPPRKRAPPSRRRRVNAARNLPARRPKRARHWRRRHVNAAKSGPTRRGTGC